MLGAVFIETLRRTWKQTLLWGLGFGAMALLIVFFIPLFDAMDFIGLMQSLPPAILGAFGVGDDVSVMATSEGLMATTYFNRFMLFFAIYPIMMGLRVTVNEEDEGILDMMLSLPVSRTWLLIERVAAYIVTIPVVVAMIFGAIVLGDALSNAGIDITVMAQLSISLIPIMIFLLCITVMLGVFIHRRNIAVAVSVVFVVASFSLYTVGNMAADSIFAEIATLSFFKYYDAVKILQGGVSIAHASLLIGIAIIGMMLATWRFQQRDVSV